MFERQQKVLFAVTPEPYGIRTLSLSLIRRQEGYSQFHINVGGTGHFNSWTFEAFSRQRRHTQVVSADVFADPRYLAEWSDERAF